MRPRSEEIGKNGDHGRRRDRIEHAEVDARHVERAVANLGHGVVFRIAIVIAQHRDAELAAAAFAHQLVDMDDALHRRIVEWIDSEERNSRALAEEAASANRTPSKQAERIVRVPLLSTSPPPKTLTQSP
jgi:hypothetical protein